MQRHHGSMFNGADVQEPISHISFLSLFLCLLFFSVAVCRFPNTGDDWYVLVGVARDMILNPRSVGGGFIYTYRLVSGGEKLEFVHKVGLTLKRLTARE